MPLLGVRRLQVDHAAVMECADNLAFMRPLKSASMKLVVTSPPYNIGKSYESRSPLAEYVKAQAQVISECVRLLEPTGSLCWQVGNHVQKGEIFPLDMVLYPVFQEHGLKLRNRIVWHFEHGLHCSKRLSGRYETILWLTKGDDYTFHLDPIRVPSKYPGKKYFKGPKAGQLSGNPLGKNPGDVWIFPNVKNNHVEKTDHPCQFPVELVERLVLSLTDPGDAVFDPYMGVGTSIVAALINALFLLVAITVIAVEAVQRFSEPATVGGRTVIIVAAIGIVVNTITALMFMRGSKGDINIRRFPPHGGRRCGVSRGRGRRVRYPCDRMDLD